MAIEYNRIVKYIINAVCNGPLHIGSSEGGKEEVLIHPVTNFPFIQASSIAGVFRSNFASNHSMKETAELFGASSMEENTNAYDMRSRIKFSDGIFSEESVKMELRPHVKIDRETGSVSNSKGFGQKFEMEYIGKGSEFKTVIYLYDDVDENQSFDRYMNELLAELVAGNMCFGAKKSSGAGNISVKSILKKSFDMTNAEDRKIWMDEENIPDNLYKNILAELPKVESGSVKYKVTIKGTTESSLLVKGLATSSFGEDAPDSENIKNALNEYIVPGSSFRGTIRSQLEKISRFIDKESIIQDAFGKVSKNDDEGYAGNLIFRDAVIVGKKTDSNMIRHRIHIDKFTGGVFNKGLFSESNVAGQLELSIDVLNKNNADATLGLLLLGLRDLAIKSVNLGSGYATGKGFIDVSSITILAGNNSATIDFSNSANIEDPAGIISNAMRLLKELV